MKTRIRRITAMLLVLLLLPGLIACGNKNSGTLSQTGEQGSTDSAFPHTRTGKGKTEEDGKGEEGEEQAKEQTQDQEQTGLELLRACMERTPQIALAAAYLGYREENDLTPLTDWMWVNSPGLMEEMDFIRTIPEDRILGAGYGDLYCLVPRDDNTTLSVNHIMWESKGNGVWPEADEVLYRSEYARPVLVFVGYEEFQDEPNVGIQAIAGNGAQVEWYPEAWGLVAEDGYDYWYSYQYLPVGMDDKPLILDFTNFGDVTGLDGQMAPEDWVSAGDDWWLAPTEVGLSGTVWVCDGWSMELDGGNCDPDYAGTVKLYHQFEDGQEYEPVYSGVWRMEEDCLRLELSAGVGTSYSGSFPVLIAPSGEQLYIQQSRDGYTSPPFFADDQFFMEMTLSYG